MVYAFLFREGAVSRRRRRSSGAAPAGRRRRSELVAFRRGAAPADNLGWLPAQLAPDRFRAGQCVEGKAGCTEALQRAHSDAYRSHRGHENAFGCGGCVLACL